MRENVIKLAEITKKEELFAALVNRHQKMCQSPGFKKRKYISVQ